MRNKALFTRYRKDLVVALIVASSALALLGSRLWLTLPFNCYPGECWMPFTYLQQQRISLFLAFGPLAAIALALAAVFVRRHPQEKTAPFSSFGLVALVWPVVLFILSVINPFWGVVLAPIGVGLAIIAIAWDVTYALRTKGLAPFHWGNVVILPVNIAWWVYWYLLLLRFFEVFGD